MQAYSYTSKNNSVKQKTLSGKRFSGKEGDAGRKETKKREKSLKGSWDPENKWKGCP